MAFPFYPMTDEMLKKLSQAVRDSDQTINFSDLPAELESQELKSTLELNSPDSNTGQSDIRTINQY